LVRRRLVRRLLVEDLAERPRLVAQWMDRAVLRLARAVRR
jgi:hypothetical protein